MPRPRPRHLGARRCCGTIIRSTTMRAGRLLLAPYAKREAGLSTELTGILSNPMNQEVPSRVAVTGVLAFAWNDKGYDADRTWHYAARNLAGNDARATQALLELFDTQHLAPTFGS
ncbi:beta-N-acetylglucosaminidase domain-containing protein, partial [Klebsiella pneumoniae]|uniref:beta-N-acetylglucosaminidase domain-containing protein n=1 Tax=Klebsiella pneumoniae TaxID=573 RepID=UPI00322160EB